MSNTGFYVSHAGAGSAGLPSMSYEFCLSRRGKLGGLEAFRVIRIEGYSLVWIGPLTRLE